jgi:hypothetical protein
MRPPGSLALGALLGSLMVAPAAGAQPVAMTTVSADSTTLHARCDAGSPTRGVLARGTEVEVESVVETWVNVRVPVTDERGCVRRADLAPVAAIARAEAERRQREQRRARGEEGPGATAPVRYTPAGGRTLRVAGFAGIGRLSPSAAKSFEAILDTSSGREVALGGQVAFRRGGLRGLFVEVEGSRFEETGERAFVSGEEVFRLGIPVEIQLTPLDVTAGYRHVFGRRARPGRPAGEWPFVPFAGAGVGTLRYRETSDFAENDENVDERFTSYHVMGGLEVTLVKYVTVGVEGRHRWVPDGLGAAGVSREFNETDLGGTSVRLRVGVGF